MPKKSKPKRKTTKTGKIHDGNSKRRKTKTQRVRGPGKPTISDDELIEQRGHWAFALENYWGEVGWNLRCARTPEDIRIALRPLSGGPYLYPLSLLLRPGTEAVTAEAIRQTKKKLSISVPRLYEAVERQRRATEAFRNAESAVAELSQENQKHLRTEIQRRKKNLRGIMIGILGKKAEIRRTELHLKKATEQDRPSIEAKLKSLQVELEKIETEMCTENSLIKQIEQRLWSVTPEKRRVVAKVYADRKVELDAANQNLSDANAENKRIEEMLSDHQAHYCQRELLKLIRGKRYSHAPRNLANAIAGLPAIGCRQSAFRCARIPYTWEPNDTVFNFVERTWRRREPLQSKAQQVLNLFRDEIEALPKTLLSQPDKNGERKKIDNYFRRDLCDKWFYLRKAVGEALQMYKHPNQVPYLILAKFRENLAKPRTAADDLLAAQERLEV